VKRPGGVRRFVRLFSAAAAAGAALPLWSCLGSPRPPETVASLPMSTSSRLGSLARSCARIASCAHTHDPLHSRDPAACVDHWILEGASPTLACLSSALTCDAVGACLHSTPNAAGEAFCGAHPGELTGCDRNRLVLCGGDDPDEATLVDCASFGAECSALTQAGGLSTHACVDPRRCPPELTRAWCDGGKAVLACHDGEIERTACPAASPCHAHTEADGEQAAACEAPGHPSCKAPGSTQCVGSVLVTCEAHGHFGHEHSVDCAAAGLACTEVGGRAACTDGPPECGRGQAVCEGDALTFCAAGKRVHVRCRELGLDACEVDGRGPEAACRPSK
jgi:hypothetical protein